MRKAAAALHAFYQGHCLDGKGEEQLLASPRSSHGEVDEATDRGGAMTLYDDDSWLQDDQDSPISIRSDNDGNDEECSPTTSMPPTPGVPDDRASSVTSPSTPISHETLDVAAETVGRFAPAAQSLFLEAINADGRYTGHADSDSAVLALELYTEGLKVAMGVVRQSKDKEAMKKSLEPYFARAFSLRSEAAAAKTAKEAAIAALAKKKEDTAGAKLAEGVPPVVPPRRMQPGLSLSPRSPSEPTSPQPDDPAYQAFIAARQALKGTLQRTPGSPTE